MIQAPGGLLPSFLWLICSDINATIVDIRCSGWKWIEGDVGKYVVHIKESEAPKFPLEHLWQLLPLQRGNELEHVVEPVGGGCQEFPFQTTEAKREGEDGGPQVRKRAIERVVYDSCHPTWCQRPLADCT